MHFRSTAWESSQEADCGIVLTGGVGRIREGIDLLSRKQIKKLIISGVNPSSTFFEIVPYWPFYPEVSEKNVILEKRSETTFGNATQSLPLVEILSCQEVLLITSELHMYRSQRTFKKVFPSYIDLKLHAIPNSRIDDSFFDNLQETIKSVFYSLWAY